MQNRRTFLKNSGKIAGAISLTSLLGEELFANYSTTPFGIQLYTLRDIIEKDVKGTLKQLASYGYKQIESYEGPQGMFWGLGANEFKKYTNSIGLNIISSHAEINIDFERKVEEAASIGMKYLICPWLGPQKSIDDFKKAAQTFNEKGELCKKSGIRFAYHNHDYSFKTINGELPQEVLLMNTDPSLVDFELDLYWMVTAGYKPEEWFNHYANRFKLCHIKDKSKTADASGNYPTVNLGTGSIDFKKILTNAKKYGMKYYIVEQEHYLNETPLEAAKAGANYMRKLVF
jgi:sugar phosphate isomerase/epimerase